MSFQPNILFIFADQLRADVLGCYGGQVATPGLDRLAERGVRLTNAISTYPFCSPYRAMLLTGRYPASNGVTANTMRVRDGVEPIATILKRRGYRTGYIGKWHLDNHTGPFVAKENRLGFDYWAVRNCAHQYFDSYYCGDTEDKIPLPGYEPEAQANLAIDFIQRHRDEPFCLFVSWGPPHNPYVAPEEFISKFPREGIQLPANVRERGVLRSLLEADSELTEEQAEKRRTWRERLESDDCLREMIQGYFASASALDHCLGPIIDAVDEAGLAERTIVVYTSDHGDMLGSHGMGNKLTPFEEAIRIPFVLSHPEAVPAGLVTDGLLAPVDVMSTLLDLAGVDVPQGMEGISCAEALSGGGSDQQEALLLMSMTRGTNSRLANGVREWRGVRTKRHTYARMLGVGPWLLYDNQADPGQMRNLVNNPDYSELRDELEATMRMLMQRTGDTFE